MSDSIEYEEEPNIKEEYEVLDVIEEFVVSEDLTDADEDSEEITLVEEIIDEEGNDEDSNVEVISEFNVDIRNGSPVIENDEVTEINNDKSEDLYHCNICDVHFIGSVERHLEIYHANKSVPFEKNESLDLLTTNDPENVGAYINEDPISIKAEYDSECELYQVERLDETEEDRLSDTVETESIKSDYEINLSVVEESSKNSKSKKLFNCNLCPMVFPYSRLLTIHMKNHVKEGSNELASYSSKYYKYVKVKRECKECELIFENRQEQVKHMKTQHMPLKKPNKKKIVKSTPKPPVEVSCEVCKTIFNSSKNLKLHMRIHNPIKSKSIEEAIGPGGSKIIDDCSQFFCEICNKSFDERLLAAHRNMHQNSPDYVCGICNRSLENKASYDLHMNLHFGEEEQIHWKSRLPQRTNPKLKFVCSFCGRAFARPHEKVKHERVHTGEKPHECEVCGKSFRVSYSLTLHLRTHSDLRPFVCSHCHKRFKSYTVYNHHLRTHSDERPFQCPFCPKAFKTGVQLAGHKNGHTKPFSCTECNRPFSSLYSVKIHMKTHNKTNKSNQNLKHACCICGAVYARIFALRSHMKDIHNSELPGYRGLASDSTTNRTTDTTDADVLSENTFVKTEISNDALLQGEEVSNFQTEEIVTDWMIK